MITVVPQIKVYLVKIFHIFTFALAKDQVLLLLRCISSHLTCQLLEEKKKNYKTWKGKFLEARHLYLIDGGGGGEFGVFQTFWGKRPLQFIFFANSTIYLISERLAPFCICGVPLCCYVCTHALVNAVQAWGRAL